MAKEMVRSGGRQITDKTKAIHKADSSSPRGQAKKHAKKAAKHAAKNHAKKAVKHGSKAAPEFEHAQTDTLTDDLGMMTAFHHMQRATVVISLMEKGTGEDLRDLLDRGVKLYRRSLDGDGGKQHVLRAIGVLRAAEHLSMAGLYSAREKHRQKVASPGPKWLKDFIAKTDRKLEQIEGEERGKGDLFPVTVELLRQAEETDRDAHLAFELAMAADALCFALENGL